MDWRICDGISVDALTQGRKAQVGSHGGGQEERGMNGTNSTCVYRCFDETCYFAD